MTDLRRITPSFNQKLNRSLSGVGHATKRCVALFYFEYDEGRLSAPQFAADPKDAACFVLKNRRNIMSLKDTCISAWEALPVSIESGASITDTINLGGLRLFGIVMPQEWTTANLTFQASFDAGVTWLNILNKAGNENTVTVSASGYVVVDSADFAAIQYLKIRSGSSAAPIAQQALRNISLVLRRI